MLCNSNGVLPHLQMGVAVMGLVEDFHYSLCNKYKYIFCPIWNLLCVNGNLKTNFSKKNPIQPLKGVLPICKLLFPNGSYRNWVCRALWA